MLAATASALAVLLWRPSERWILRRRLGVRHSRTTRHPPAALLLPASAAVAVAMATAVTGAHAIVLFTCAGLLVFGGRQWRRDRARRTALKRTDAVSEVLRLLAAELRAGSLPRQALSGLAADFDFLAPSARAADLGGDVSSALRQAAAVPGAELLDDLASAWQVAERAGAPLAQVLERLERTAENDREIVREVQSGAAPARVSGRLMAVLPVFGLALGSGMGGDPVDVLTNTVVGALCLAVGVALACAGVTWVDHIVEAAERVR